MSYRFSVVMPAMMLSSEVTRIPPSSGSWSTWAGQSIETQAQQMPAIAPSRACSYQHIFLIRAELSADTPVAVFI